MNMKALILILIFVFQFYKIEAQKMEDITHRKMIIHHKDSMIECDVLITTDIKPKKLIPYYWYDRENIFFNQGGFSGKLLDGKYQVFTKNKKLITAGSFKNGTKSKQWREWDAEGKLMNLYSWRKGQKNGVYQLFSEDKLVEEGKYKNGLLQGKQIIYKTDTTVVNYFRGGKMILPKTKKEKQPSSNDKNENKQKVVSEKKDKKPLTKENRKTKKDD